MEGGEKDNVSLESKGIKTLLEHVFITWPPLPLKLIVSAIVLGEGLNLHEIEIGLHAILDNVPGVWVTEPRGAEPHRGHVARKVAHLLEDFGVRLNTTTKIEKLLKSQPVE